MTVQRFEKGNKQRTRRQILDVASRQLRSRGIAASGLAGIMADAGLTNGAFYAHFSSKEALVQEMLAETLADRRDTLSQVYALEAAIRGYLNVHHMDGPDRGCPSAALLPEISRQPVSTRQVYEDGLHDYIAKLALLMPGNVPDAHATAFAVFALMVGTMQVARAVVDRRLAEDLLENGIKAALALAMENRSP